LLSDLRLAGLQNFTEKSRDCHHPRGNIVANENRNERSPAGWRYCGQWPRGKPFREKAMRLRLGAVGEL
jgi:hypothetical protein